MAWPYGLDIHLSIHLMPINTNNRCYLIQITGTMVITKCGTGQLLSKVTPVALVFFKCFVEWIQTSDFTYSLVSHAGSSIS